jgi:hypothetical protein
MKLLNHFSLFNVIYSFYFGPNQKKKTSTYKTGNFYFKETLIIFS